MAQSLSQIIVHVIFSTKDRQPWLRDRLLREELHRVLGGILEDLDCQPLIVGGVEDHVHLLCLLSRKCSPSDLVKEVKRRSSLWIKPKSPELADFAWQHGYGMFSLGHSQIGAARKYIEGQEEHHRTTSFQDELRKFLDKYQVSYEERYVWD